MRASPSGTPTIQFQRGLGRCSRGSGWPWCASVLTLGELFIVDEGEREFARFAQHRDDDVAPDVFAVVAVLVVDQVTARLPESFSGPDDTFRLTFQLERRGRRR